MTDQEHAEAINQARDAFNRACLMAAAVGVSVTARIEPGGSQNSTYPRLETRVVKELRTS